MIVPSLRLLCLAIVILSCASCKEVNNSSHSREGFSKVDNSLVLLAEEYRARPANDDSPTDFQTSITGLMVVEDRVIIDAVAINHGAELKRQMEDLGGIHCSSYELLVSCHFPITNIEKLEGLQGLRFVRPAMATTHETGN